MYIPFFDYINQLQNNQTVINQTNRSNGLKFMLNTKITTVPTLPKLTLLINADTY